MTMCRRVECRTCGKPTYAGCGQHVEQVLGGVPKSQRCHCTPKTGGASRILRKLLGRS